MTLLLFFRNHIFGTPTPPPTGDALRGVHTTLSVTRDRQAQLAEKGSREATLS